MVKSVISGNNYIRGKRDTVLLAEALRLQIDAFASLSHNTLKDAKVQESIIVLQSLSQNHNPKTNYSWEQYQEPMDEFLQAFHDYVENGCLRSKSFHFWIISLNDILPILIDLTKSNPKGD